MPSLRTVLVWTGLALAVILPIAAAAGSPLLQWRQPIYIIAGFAGIVGMVLLLVQPLLAAGLLPGLHPATSRRLHRICGVALFLAVMLHVAGLWITSPPDVIDALTFTSPTPFSAWGVIAMWAVIAAAGLAAFRRRLRLRVMTWRMVHLSLAVVTVLGTVAHALLIDGTMETFSKFALSVLVLAALARVLYDLRLAPRAWRKKRGRT
ncbi:MAG: ferric reductase-like transmembrane domain-containing protein [Pseudomonadota bacterium]